MPSSRGRRAAIIIDTPPTPMEPIERAIAAADVVVIPTRVGLFDLGGIRPVIAFCQKHNKPFLFMLTGTNPMAPGWPRLIKIATGSLKKIGPVLAKSIRERAIYISSLTSGKSAPEAATSARRRLLPSRSTRCGLPSSARGQNEFAS